FILPRFASRGMWKPRVSSWTQLTMTSWTSSKEEANHGKEVETEEQCDPRELQGGRGSGDSAGGRLPRRRQLGEAGGGAGRRLPVVGVPDRQRQVRRQDALHQHLARPAGAL